MGTGALSGHHAQATSPNSTCLVTPVSSPSSLGHSQLSKSSTAHHCSSETASQRSVPTLRQRLCRPMQVATGRSVLHRIPLLARLHGDEAERERRRIRRTDNIGERLTLGAIVFPTVQGTEVRYGVMKNTGQEVVVKVRRKYAFYHQGEESDWRMNTEFMLNLPKSESIAQLFEVLEDAQSYYVVMEKAAGQDLFEAIDCNGRPPLAESKKILHQLLTAVAELHKRGAIHKDLKLENVMIAPSPKRQGTHSSFNSTIATDVSLKLIDFDTVEVWSPGGSHHKASTVVGTDQYIAQEAYAGNYSPASDIFSVGVIAYKLLTGRFPFSSAMFDDEQGENWVGSPKMNMIRKRLCQFPINFEVSPFLSDPQARDFCASMLAVEESDRPEAAAALQHPWLSQAAPPCPKAPALRGCPGQAPSRSDYIKGVSRTPRPTGLQPAPGTHPY